MKITAKSEDIQITGTEDFIAIGEQHNSRSAIKFIFENINKLAPNPQQPTYFLVESLPPGIHLENTFNFQKAVGLQLVCANKKSGRTYDGERGAVQDAGGFTLHALYNLLLERGVKIISIEPGAPTAQMQHASMIGDIKGWHKARIDSMNLKAKGIAREIWHTNNNAKILVFAGMSHIDDITTYIKYGADGVTEVQSALCFGISALLKQEKKSDGVNRVGLSIDVHDPELCDHTIELRNIDSVVDEYTKYDKGDKKFRLVVVGKADYLLFLDTPEHTNKGIAKNGYDSIFLPGKFPFHTIIDTAQHESIFLMYEHQPDVDTDDASSNLAEDDDDAGLCSEDGSIRQLPVGLPIDVLNEATMAKIVDINSTVPESGSEPPLESLQVSPTQAIETVEITGSDLSMEEGKQLAPSRCASASFPDTARSKTTSSNEGIKIKTPTHSHSLADGE